MAGLARTALLALLMICAPLSGCVGNDDDMTMPTADDLNVMPEVWSAGEWTRVTFTADAPLSVFVPHFLRSNEVRRSRSSWSIFLPPADADGMGSAVGVVL